VSIRCCCAPLRAFPVPEPGLPDTATDTSPRSWIKRAPTAGDSLLPHDEQCQLSCGTVLLSNTHQDNVNALASTRSGLRSPSREHPRACKGRGALRLGTAWRRASFGQGMARAWRCCLWGWFRPDVAVASPGQLHYLPRTSSTGCALIATGLCGARNPRRFLAGMSPRGADDHVRSRVRASRTTALLPPRNGNTSRTCLGTGTPWHAPTEELPRSLPAGPWDNRRPACRDGWQPWLGSPMRT
jgi:hypothetical protein